MIIKWLWKKRGKERIKGKNTPFSLSLVCFWPVRPARRPSAATPKPSSYLPCNYWTLTRWHPQHCHSILQDTAWISTRGSIKHGGPNPRSVFHLRAAAAVALVSDRAAAFGAAEQRTSTRHCCWRRSWSLAESRVKEAICCLTAICKPWPSFPIRGDCPKWDLGQVLCLLVLSSRAHWHVLCRRPW